MSESQTEPLELDEVGVLEWRVYELEGRLASLAYDQTKALAARPQVVPCVRCSHPTTRSSLVCIFCEHGTKGRSPLPET